MYADHFCLNEAPFSITPDPAFAYASRSHVEALATLLLAIEDGQGFIKITGEVGTGKTLACRRILAALAQRAPVYETAYLPHPRLTPRALLLAIAQELRLKTPDNAPDAMLLATLNEHLLDAARNGRRVIACLDEAQAMPLETLESLRLISNLETEKRKLIQIVLFGQPELEHKLARELHQLASRITFQYRLSALGPDETEHYLAHRLQVAGYRAEENGDAPLFAPSVARRLHRATRGVPRLINIVAHKALLLAYGEGATRVLAHHVRAAAADTPAVRLVSAKPEWTARFVAWIAPPRTRII